MKNPKPITPRKEINLRHGIKSSLPKMKTLFASVYTLYKISPNNSLIEYSKEIDQSGSTKIQLIDALHAELFAFFENQLTTSTITQNDFLIQFNQSPLFTSQLEALQVALQLYWKLGEIDFVINMASSKERTGGKRFNKKINFSINIDIIDNVLTNENIELTEETKNLIFNYITQKGLPTSNIEQKLIKTLTVLSEEVQFKIRDEAENEIFFQHEGIYSEVIDGSSVINKDPKEDVGPFRILKNTVKEGLNHFIEDDRTNGFQLKAGITPDEIKNYYNRVNTYLDLSAKGIDVEPDSDGADVSTSINKIYYGAPGTGKSHRVNQLLKGKENRTERITFHPEFDYTSFVGGYKPTMDGKDIRYEFVPQAFTNIYVKAWNDPDSDYYLVIEEINRGNCAEIFGDIFQLLDRNDSYKITPSKELKEYLEKALAENEKVDAGKLLLPPNLNILATMNTSDQSLFPMDSAFKRRWNWEYIPINYEVSSENKSAEFVVQLTDNQTFLWLDFIKAVNEIIKQNDNLGMDKCIGNYFIKPQNNIIELEEFINKAIFYLWNDVFKDEMEDDSIFKDKTTYEDFFPIDTQGNKKVNEILKQLDITITDSTIQ